MSGSDWTQTYLNTCWAGVTFGAAKAGLGQKIQPNPTLHSSAKKTTVTATTITTSLLLLVLLLLLLLEIF